MIIKTDNEFRRYQQALEEIIAKGTALGDMGVPIVTIFSSFIVLFPQRYMNLGK